MKSIMMAFVSLFAGSAFAAGYGDAGCGLGSQVMGPEKGAKQVLAATTNGTSANQTFGITSGTSNCQEGGIFKSAKQVPAYIEMNKIALAKDAARGEGETLAGLSNLMGCDNAALGHAVKANYNDIFVQTNMDPSLIESAIKSHAGNACGA